MNNTKSILSSLLLFLSLAMLGVTIFYYYSKIIGIIIIVVPYAYKFVNKHGAFGPLDEFFTKLLSSPKNHFYLSFVLIILSLGIILINESKDNIEIPIQEFAGIVWDENNEPLSNVIIVLPELNLKDTTDNLGMFRFHLRNFEQSSISLMATKEGYETFEGEGSSNNKSYNFKMKKK